MTDQGASESQLHSQPQTHAESEVPQGSFIPVVSDPLPVPMAAPVLPGGGPYAPQVPPYYRDYSQPRGYTPQYAPLYPPPYAIAYPYNYAAAPYMRNESQHFMEALTKQIDFYFSWQNLSNDSYLTSQMDRDLFVPIQVIANFNKVQNYTRDITIVLQVMKSSPHLVVDEKTMRVRPSIQFRRTILNIRDLPSSYNKEAVEKLVSSAKVSNSFNVRSEVNESWVVEFENEDDAFAGFEYLKAQSVEGRSVNVRLRLDPQTAASPLPQTAIYPDVVDSPKPYAIPQPYVQQPYGYYPVTAPWRPGPLPHYNYGGYDPSFNQQYRYHQKSYPGARPFKGKGRRDYQKPEDDQGHEVGDSVQELATSVENSLAVTSEVTQNESAPVTATEESVPPTQAPTSDKVEGESDSQQDATVAAGDSSAQPSHRTQSRPSGSESAYAGQGYGDASKMRKKKGKKPGYDQYHSGGTEYYSRPAPRLQPDDFPPLPSNVGSKPALSPTSAGPKTGVQTYSKNQIIDIISNISAPAKPESQTQEAVQNIVLEAPVTNLVVQKADPPKETKPKSTWNGNARGKDKPESSKESQPSGAAATSTHKAAATPEAANPTEKPANTQEQGSFRRSNRRESGSDRHSFKHTKPQEPLEMQIVLKPSSDSTASATATATTTTLPSKTTETIAPKTASSTPTNAAPAKAKKEKTETEEPKSLSNEKKSYAAAAKGPQSQQTTQSSQK